MRITGRAWPLLRPSPFFVSFPRWFLSTSLHVGLELSVSPLSLPLLLLLPSVLPYLFLLVFLLVRPAVPFDFARSEFELRYGQSIVIKFLVIERPIVQRYPFNR